MLVIVASTVLSFITKSKTSTFFIYNVDSLACVMMIHSRKTKRDFCVIMYKLSVISGTTKEWTNLSSISRKGERFPVFSMFPSREFVPSAPITRSRYWTCETPTEHCRNNFITVPFQHSVFCDFDEENYWLHSWLIPITVPSSDPWHIQRFRYIATIIIVAVYKTALQRRSPIIQSIQVKLCSSTIEWREWVHKIMTLICIPDSIAPLDSMLDFLFLAMYRIAFCKGTAL